MTGDLKTFRNAIENRVVKCEHEMFQSSESFRPVIRMECIHGLEPPNPRRFFDLEYRIWRQPTRGQWVS